MSCLGGGFQNSGTKEITKLTTRQKLNLMRLLVIPLLEDMFKKRFDWLIPNTQQKLIFLLLSEFLSSPRATDVIHSSVIFSKIQMKCATIINTFNGRNLKRLCWYLVILHVHFVFVITSVSFSLIFCTLKLVCLNSKYLCSLWKLKKFVPFLMICHTCLFLQCRSYKIINQSKT